MFREEESRSYAFNLIVRKHQERLYWMIRKMVLDHDDADDVLQNVFIKVWKGLDKFNAQSQMYTWMYRIAANECSTFLTKKSKMNKVSMDDMMYKLADTLESDVHYDGDEIDRKLQKAIATLPEKQKVVFTMRYYQEMKYEQISEALGTSVGALKASYHHAVKKIEEELKSD